MPDPILHIRLLGGMTLTWGDAPLPPIPGAVACSLFAYLSTYRDRPHTRDLLAGIFWPDLPNEAARRRLSRAMWLIRKALEPHQVLLTEGYGVQLHPGLPVRIDVAEFERQAAGSQQQDAALAADLYRGDFLDGYYDDWLLVERERLREMFLAVLERLVAGLKAQGEYERALAYARRLASEDPLREGAHREVMRLCHLLGRDSEALQQYGLCCQVLADELAAEPSAATVALADEIAAQAQKAEIPHLPVASHMSPVPLLDQPDRIPLVGRQAERAELARHLEEAIAGRGGLLLLSGAAGVGKTRLMQELARDAAWRGVVALWGHSCELSAPVPYQPLVEALNAADLTYPIPGDRVAWRGELARLMPGLGPLPPALEPEQERARLLEALAQAFLTLGRQGQDRITPHLIILEDVHWMDLASFDALRVLLPRLPDSHLLVVGTLRPEELVGRPLVRRALDGLEATRIPRRIELGPLTEAESQSLIEHALDLAQPAPYFSLRLYVRTEGNPFFVAETLRMLAEEGLLYRDETGGWRTPWDQASGEHAKVPMPQSIVQSIEQRLARLAPETQELLGVAAVVGRRVEFDLWLAASEEDEERLLDAIEDLVRRGLLVDTEDVVGYCFAHEITRQVVYDRMSPVRQRWWHRRVAEALEALHPDQVEALARHHRLGQNWLQAVKYARQAGERAQAVYAHQQALDHYDNADGWLTEGRVSPSAVEDGELIRWRADLAEKRGQVYNFVGQYERAEAAFSQARQMWVDVGDWRSVARVLNHLSFLYFLRYDYVKASHYAQLALAALPEQAPPADLQATSLTYLGLSAWTEGRYDEALPPLEEALFLFEQIDTDLYGLARCLNSLGLVYLDRGEFEQAALCFSRSIALRQQIGDRRGVAWCWHNRGRMALAQGDLVAARDRLETARAIFVEIEHPDGVDTCAQTLAKVEQAEAAARRAGRISVCLPRADAPLGRSLRNDEYVTVTWTVDLPEDAAVPHKADRRRRRLLRLLAEAQSQGAVPAYHHLAQALKVNERTVERDMAALRQEHPDLPPTRRKMSE